jgi:hypothetical protein
MSLLLVLRCAAGPEMQEDAGGLFPAAAVRTSGHGIGGGLDRGDTMRSAGTAGIASTSVHSPTAYQSSFSHGGYGSDGLGAGEAAGLGAGLGAGAAAGAYGFNQRQSYYAPQEPQYPHEAYGHGQQYDEQAYGGYHDPAQGYGGQEQPYDDGNERPHSGSDLGRYGSVASRADRPLNLHVANM